MSDHPPHLTPDEFQRLGHRAIDFIADYMRTVESMPVLSNARPGSIYDAFPDAPPEQGLGSPDGWNAVFDDLREIILPGLTHWQHPSFFAYFPCNASGPGILGELLAAGLGVQGMLWQTSPACTELETRCLDWLVDALALPDAYHSRRSGARGGGVIQHTASDATLVALLAGRHRALAAGATHDALTLYASAQAHSSITKAAMVAGLAAGPDDRSRLRLIPTDAQHRMDARALEEALRADRAAGRTPAFVCATIGTTGCEAVDPVPALAGAIDRATPAGAPRPWLHADAAFTGSALVCPEHRDLAAGLDRCDSFCFNPHKWMLTNFDCDALFTADRATLTGALSITPEYLRNAASEAGAVIDYRDWHVPLGRKFRALKLWLVLRHYGLEGLRAHIRAHVALARDLEARLAADPRFTLAAPRTTALLCLRVAHADPDRADTLTRALMDAVNQTGRAFLTHTTLPIGGVPRVVLRIAIGGTHTARPHTDALWSLLTEHAGSLLRSEA